MVAYLVVRMAVLPKVAFSNTAKGRLGRPWISKELVRKARGPEFDTQNT